MSIFHDDSQYGAFKDLLEDSRAPVMDTNEYKMEIVDIVQSSTGMAFVLA